MNRTKVVLIAHQDQENLGVDYLSSMLLSKGFDVETVDFGLPKDEIYSRVKEVDPLMVGFSLVFQYHCSWLRELAEYLRESGLDCHFTVGGHYPSLRFEDILDVVPHIDSVVRFEGELTICELADCLAKNRDWRKIKSIAYRSNGKPISNELRPLIGNLDTIPFPVRIKERKFQCMGKNYAHVIASRGCVRNCSFCSVRKFYETPPGKLRRSRSPTNVAKELRELHEKNEISVFLFQDDDFFLPGKLGRKWVLHFIDELESEGFADKILWKISCRADEVEFSLFKKMKKAGLFGVYLGIESGNQTGLNILNKGLSAQDNIRAVETLNRLKILYEYGFMLFDPTSTFKSIRTNISFLRSICGDGSSPAVFCKMMPYAETDIEKKLANEGRLKGSLINPDYDFLDPKIDDFCEFLHMIFHEWMFINTGMLARLRWNRFEITVLEKFYPYAKGVPEYKNFLKEIVASSNALFFHVAEKASTIFEENSIDSPDQLRELVKLQQSETENITSKLYQGMIDFHRKQQQICATTSEC